MTDRDLGYGGRERPVRRRIVNTAAVAFGLSLPIVIPAIVHHPVESLDNYRDIPSASLDVAGDTVDTTVQIGDRTVEVLGQIPSKGRQVWAILTDWD